VNRLKGTLAIVGLIAALGVMLWSVRSVPVSADGELALQVTGVDTSEYPMVHLLVTVIDQDGRSPENLSKENFSVEADGDQLLISAVDGSAHGDLGVSSLLVIDTSGSMEGQPIEAARQAAGAFMAPLRAVDEVGILSFADSVVTLSPFTGDFTRAAQSLSSLSALGNTALYQAVAEAAQVSAARDTQRQAIILVSDGADFGGVSTISRSESLAIASRAGVPFYVVGFGEGIDRSYLQELAGASRGHLYIAPAIDELRSVFADISQQVLTQYSVTLDLEGTEYAGNLPATLSIETPSGNGSVQLEFALPEPEPAVVPQVVPAPVVEQQPEPASSSSWPLIIAIALLVLVVVAFAVRRFVEARSIAQDETVAPTPALTDFHEPVGAPDGDKVLARLVAPDGTKYDLFRRPISLGASEDSTYRLPAGDIGLGPSTIRVWYGSERFVVHDTSARTRLKLNGRRSRWAFLEDGDELELNGLKLQFQSSTDSS
jgi:VWFA-related protein